MAHFKALPILWQSILCSLLIANSLSGAFEYPGMGWASAAANIRVVGDEHLDRFRINPALMRGEGGTWFGIEYHRPFYELELQASQLSMKLDLGRTPWFFGINYFGDEIYGEMAWIGGCSRSFGENLRMGGCLQYLRYKMMAYPAASSFTFSPGLHILVGQYVQLGSVLENLIQSKGMDQIPQRFRMGMSYKPGDLTLLLALEKEALNPMAFKMGIELELGSCLTLAGGYQNLTQGYSAGWNLELGPFSLYYSWVAHPHLPWSHGLGLDLRFP